MFGKNWVAVYTEPKSEGHFPLGGIFRAERHFLLFKDQLAESGRQNTKENIIPHGKFRPVENGPKTLGKRRNTMSYETIIEKK